MTSRGDFEKLLDIYVAAATDLSQPEEINKIRIVGARAAVVTAFTQWQDRTRRAEGKLAALQRR